MASFKPPAVPLSKTETEAKASDSAVELEEFGERRGKLEFDELIAGLRDVQQADPVADEAAASAQRGGGGLDQVGLLAGVARGVRVGDIVAGGRHLGLDGRKGRWPRC